MIATVTIEIKIGKSRAILNGREYEFKTSFLRRMTVNDLIHTLLDEEKKLENKR